MSDNISPVERRELRSVVRGQFKVLRAEVKRREQELKSEVEQELLDRYRTQSQLMHDVAEQIARINAEAVRQAKLILDELHAADPDIVADISFAYGKGMVLSASSKSREQLRRAALAKIPDIVGDANLSLDRQEVSLLRRLSEGALESAEAAAFLSEIPSVGELVPTARLRELAASVDLSEGGAA